MSVQLIKEGGIVGQGGGLAKECPKCGHASVFSYNKYSWLGMKYSYTVHICEMGLQDCDYQFTNKDPYSLKADTKLPEFEFTPELPLHLKRNGNLEILTKYNTLDSLLENKDETASDLTITKMTMDKMLEDFKNTFDPYGTYCNQSLIMNENRTAKPVSMCYMDSKLHAVIELTTKTPTDPTFTYNITYTFLQLEE